MRVALQVIDSIVPSYGPLDYRLGGGTVLMFRFDHRISKDIDIFFHDAQVLSYLTPRLNDVAAGVAEHYEEHANVIKLVVEDGDIDFIVAPDVVSTSPIVRLELDGRGVPCEGTAEILAKKLLFRADAFKIRDVFDLAVGLALDPEAAATALRETARTRPALLRRLAVLQQRGGSDLAAGLLATTAGQFHIPGMIERVSKAVAAVDVGGQGWVEPIR